MGTPRSTATVAAALLVGLGASCATGTEPLEEGTYKLTVMGSVTESFEGRATFTVLPGGWGILLAPREPDTDGWSVLLTRWGPPPRAGQTVVVGEVVRTGDAVLPHTDATGHVSHFVRPGPGTAWDSRSGWIQIAYATRQQLVGTFDVTAKPYTGNGPGPIRVTGAFAAACLPGARC